MTLPLGAPPSDDAPEAAPSPVDEPEDETAASLGAELLTADDLDAICPYLTSTGGAWRSAVPARDHRCGAVDPPAPLTADKQRELCLSVDHASCATYRAARAARAATLLPGGDAALVAAADARRRPLARTAPVVLEPPRLIDQAARLPFDRVSGQVALVALMIVAFAAVGFARLSAGAGSEQSPSPSVSASPTAEPTPTPTRRPTPSPAASASGSALPGSPSASPVAVATPPPSFRATYTVRANDTLIGIAGTFRTTVQAIRDANGLAPGAILRIGQILNIP